VAQFKGISWHVLARTERNHKHLSDLHLSWGRFETDAEEQLLDQNFRSALPILKLIINTYCIPDRVNCSADNIVGYISVHRLLS
jgi:hypothetical protein